MSTVPTQRGRARRLAVVVPLLLAVATAGCANREEPAAPAGGSTATASSQGFPVRIPTPDGNQITIERRPERIISLSASSTEALFAVGAGKQVVAVDDQSNFPAEAPKTTLSGLTPNIEAIANYGPDLVIAQHDANDLAAGMAKLDTPVLFLPAPADLKDVWAQFQVLGAATGHSDEAEKLASGSRSEIEKIVAETPRKQLSYYHELDTQLFAATSKTFIGQVYGLFGLTNIADPADTAESGGYPKLSTEHVVRSNPDLIFLADTRCCGQNAGTVAARPGWDTIKAVRTGNVVELDDDLASRWGPRIVELVRAVAAAVGKAG
ncbi:MAG TPA: ABC transporter substrate-binding protein [Actinophytocola sp.]|uniref:ABC transporter substrate-binding protein n=1 Tax=Actinophytocola sp. TaxID=1872138 RepID=UPI002DB9D9CA|nr:ABC transporter substrate-binding protein [Actinophytocola sp.]HEU5474557.1 ABC transporter substrate-binding protein [Actinophytocola sp.]